MHINEIFLFSQCILRLFGIIYPFFKSVIHNKLFVILVYFSDGAPGNPFSSITKFDRLLFEKGAIQTC